MELPIFSRTYRILSYKIFHNLGISEPISNNFENLKPSLKKAQMKMTLEEYISTALMTITITVPFVFFLIRTYFISSYELISILATVMSFFLCIVYCTLVFGGFVIYPPYLVDTIKRDIEMNVSYATTHMATIAGTGVPVYVMFKIIGDFSEYGQISKECMRISKNIKIFGYDTITAISEVAAETPSPTFKDLLWGIVSIIRSGGDLRSFLVEKSKAYMDNMKNQESEYIDTLELMAELYTTIFVAGPVLFVIMGTIMGSVGSLPIDLGLLFSIVIYFLFPLFAIGFIILLEGSKPISG